MGMAMPSRTPLRVGPADNRPPSAEVPDWTREAKSFLEWSPSRSLLASIRAYQHHRESRLPWKILACKAAILRHRFWSIVTGADIPLNTTISGGLLMPHPNGIVIHPDAKIGAELHHFSAGHAGRRTHFRTKTSRKRAARRWRQGSWRYLYRRQCQHRCKRGCVAGHSRGSDGSRHSSAHRRASSARPGQL